MIERTDNKNLFTLDRRVYKDANGALVEADDPARLTLVGNVGAAIPMADALALGLATPDGAPVGAPKAKGSVKITDVGDAPAAANDGGGTEGSDADDAPGSSQGPLSDGKALPGTAASNKAVKPKANK